MVITSVIFTAIVAALHGIGAFVLSLFIKDWIALPIVIGLGYTVGRGGVVTNVTNVIVAIVGAQYGAHYAAKKLQKAPGKVDEKNEKAKQLSSEQKYVQWRLLRISERDQRQLVPWPEKDFYDRLDVNFDASEAELRAAFRKSAMIHHPDRNPNDPAVAERFKDIKTAYETLFDEQKRILYDMSLFMAYEKKLERQQPGQEQQEHEQKEAQALKRKQKHANAQEWNLLYTFLKGIAYYLTFCTIITLIVIFITR